MKFYSPLRYPGGKNKVANYFKEIITKNQLHSGIYVEPYAGGASIALSLLLDNYVSKIIINDIDRSIYSFWYSVLKKTDEFCKLIHDTPVSIENWKKQKQIQKTKHKYGLLKVGFSTFFLNRTNRSGILNAGVIGGLNQAGSWKLNARYNKKELVDRIIKIARHKDKIKLYNMDAVVLINALHNQLPQNSLFYFDPPYYVKGKDLYLNYYLAEDHQRIAKEIIKINNQKWIITYDNVPQIRKIYSNYRRKFFKLNYSAGIRKRQGKEIMIFSDDINISRSSIVG